MNISQLRKHVLEASSALQVLALAGAGVALTAVVAAPAMAQDVTTGILSGTVQNSDMQPVADASVTVTSTDRGSSRTATTSSTGTFTVPQLPPGTYSVLVEAPGYARTQTDNVTVNLGGNTYQFTLAPETEENVIVVRATPVRTVDFSSTATGVTFDVQDVSNRIPVPRSIEAVQLLAPQATQGDSAFGNVISLGGSSVAENIYYVNGMNVTNFRTFVGGSTIPFEFYDQVQVKTGGYQAEFGRATGGAIIAITRSGSNELRGGGNFYWAPDGLRAKQPNTYTANNSLDRVEEWEGNLWASGPLIEDKLFFFAFYNPREYSSFAQGIPQGAGNTGTTQSYLERDTPFYGGKLDAEPIDGHRLEFTYFNDSNTDQQWTRTFDVATGIAGPKTYINTFEGGQNYIGKYTGNFTDWLTVSALYGRSKFRRSTLSDADTQTLTYDSRAGGIPQFDLIQGSGLVEDGRDEREFYRADVDLFVSLLGDHHIRFGVDHEILTAEANSFYSGGEYNRLFNSNTYNPFGLAPNTTFLRQRIYQSGGTFDSKNTAFYIQDNWDVTDRLQLTLGVRNDRFKNLNAAGNVFTDLKNQWAPRVGASYDVFGDRNTRVSAFYGRYYLPVAANTNIRLAGDEIFTEDWYEFTGDPLNPTLGAQLIPTTVFSDSSNPDPTTLVSTNLKPQYLDEFIVGVETRAFDRWRFRVNGIYRTLGSVLEDADLSHYAMGQFCADNPAECGGEPTLNVGGGGYVLLNPGKDAIINVAAQGDFQGGYLTIPAQYIGLPKASRKYYALEFEFERQFDGVWGLQGSYVWSRSRGNYEGGVKSDNGQDDVGLTQDFDEPGWMDGAYGFLPNHRTHQFKVFGTYQPLEWLQFGANLRVSSPRKYGCIGIYPSEDGRAQDPFGSGGADTWYCGDRSNTFTVDGQEYAAGSVLVGRGGGFDGEWEKRVDLSMAIKPKIEPLRGVTFRVDVFNIFNFDDPVDFREVGDADGPLASGADPLVPRGSVPLDPNYGDPTSYQTPRYVRFGVSLDF